MNVTISIPDDVALLIIDDIMANFPEASQTLEVVLWKYKERLFDVIDCETGKKYKVDQEKLLKGFALMFKKDKWPKGLTFPPASAEYGGEKDFESPWARWLSDADATYHDAFLQLVVLGEVIYG